jgi:hypothetical protein
MGYNISCINKHRDLGDVVPVPHTFFTTDDSDPVTAHTSFQLTHPRATAVKVFHSDRPWKVSEFAGQKPDYPVEGIITPSTPAAV